MLAPIVFRNTAAVSKARKEIKEQVCLWKSQSRALASQCLLHLVAGKRLLALYDGLQPPERLPCCVLSLVQPLPHFLKHELLGNKVSLVALCCGHAEGFEESL